MMSDPKLQHVGTFTGARTYHFRSAQALGGWALCTVNDQTGELLIVSDWGNWSHLWNPKHLGSPSLTHFIADRQGYDYLANKLMRRSAWVLDADATVKKWRGRLVEARLREGRLHARTPTSLRDTRYLHPLGDRKMLTANLAREIWDNLGSLLDDERDESIFIEHTMRIDGIGWVSEEPWEETEHRYSHEYRVLVDFILPALSKACGETTRVQAA